MKTNISNGCIYKHPNMNINEFNEDYLNGLPDKLSKENKTMFILGDFNINLLNYNIHPPTIDFRDSLSSHYFLPHILQPGRVTTNSKTLIFNAPYPKSNNYERDWSRFDQENFVLDYFSVEWDNFLLSSNTNTETSYETFLEKLSLYLILTHL